MISYVRAARRRRGLLRLQPRGRAGGGGAARRATGGRSADRLRRRDRRAAASSCRRTRRCSPSGRERERRRACGRLRPCERTGGWVKSERLPDGRWPGSGDSGDVSGLRRGAVRLLPRKRGGSGGGDLRGARRRLAVQRRDRAGAARAGVGAADRALERPPRPAAERRCSTTEGVSTAYAIPTDRPTTLSLVGLDTAGVPAYQFYDNGSADTGVVEADLPALGPEVVGLHFGSYSLAAAPVADAMAALARGEPGASSRSTRTCGRRSSPTWTSGARGCAVLFPLADLVKISAEDLELLRPGTSAEALRGGPRRHGRGARRRHRRRRGGARAGPRAGCTPRRRRRGSRSSTPSAPATPSRRRCSPGCCAIPAAPGAALAGARRGRAGRAPRLCRARRGDHLLAARRRPAARRRTDRLKDNSRWSPPSSPSSRSTW